RQPPHRAHQSARPAGPGARRLLPSGKSRQGDRKGRKRRAVPRGDAALLRPEPVCGSAPGTDRAVLHTASAAVEPRARSVRGRHAIWREVDLMSAANRQYRVGLVGYGGRGRGLTRFWQGVPEARIVAFADMEPKLLDMAHEVLPDARLYPDHQAM